MHLLDRIDDALEAKQVDAQDFERFAQDRLGAVFPGLAPIPGGTDWGRDADIVAVDAPPIRVAVTTSRDLDGVRGNMLRSIEGLKRHEHPVEQMVLANLARLSAPQRDGLQKSAANEGVAVVGIYDRAFFANQLRRAGEWRHRLLGIPGDPVAVGRLPADLARSAWVRLPTCG